MARPGNGSVRGWNSKWGLEWGLNEAFPAPKPSTMWLTRVSFHPSISHPILFCIHFVLCFSCDFKFSFLVSWRVDRKWRVHSHPLNCFWKCYIHASTLLRSRFYCCCLFSTVLGFYHFSSAHDDGLEECRQSGLEGWLKSNALLRLIVSHRKAGTVLHICWEVKRWELDVIGLDKLNLSVWLLYIINQSHFVRCNLLHSLLIQTSAPSNHPLKSLWARQSPCYE